VREVLGVTLDSSSIKGDHCVKYDQKRLELVQNLKTKDYWPESLKAPTYFRKFIVADDLSYCGFAKDEKTLNDERSKFYKT